MWGKSLAQIDVNDFDDHDDMDVMSDSTKIKDFATFTDSVQLRVSKATWKGPQAKLPQRLRKRMLMAKWM